MELFTKEKNLNERMRKSYVPASMKVIMTSVQKVICSSGDSLRQYDGNSWD